MSLAVLSLSVFKIALSARKIPSAIYTCTRNVRGRNRHTTFNTQPSPDFLDTSEYDNESDDLDLSEVVGGDERRDWHDFLSNVDLRDPDILNDLMSLEKKARNKLKRQILHKKYFKKEREISVLTWQAKEQIRYLNQKYPEEWTVDKLAESFPAGRDGIIQILKSSYIPRNHDEIRKHDKKAVRNIQQLKEKLEDESDTLEPDVRQNIEEKVKKIGNASGIKSLPLTELVTKSTLAKQSKLLRPSNKIGPFQSMLMYYDKMVDNKNENYSILPEPEKEMISGRNGHASLKQLEDEKGDNYLNKKQLFSGKSNKGKGNVQKTPKAQEERMFFNEMYDDSDQQLYNSNRNDPIKTRKDQKYLSSHKKGHKYQDDDYSNGFTSEKQISTSHRGGRGSRSFSLIENASSEKINFGRYKQEQVDERRTLKSDSPSQKFTQRPYDNVNDLIPKGGKIQKWNTAQETYNADTFGKTVITKKPYIELKESNISEHDSFEEPIKVPKRRKASYYKKGNMIYDNDGEFLYKIP